MMWMGFPVLALTALSEMLTREQVAIVLTAVILPAAALAWGTRRRREAVGLYFGAYIVALLAVFWAHEWADIHAGSLSADEWKGWLSDFVQLPYAWFYLRFVRHYLAVEAWASGWSKWLSGLERAYAAPVVLIGVDMGTGWGAASWFILLLNLLNLLGSYALAMQAWHRGVPRAGRFLLGVLPMALAGLLLAVQWAVEPGGNGINGMFPFWFGILLHVLVFMVVLGNRKTAKAETNLT